MNPHLWIEVTPSEYAWERDALACLKERLPGGDPFRLTQWHNDIDPEYHQRLGDFCETFLRSELATLGLTEEDLRMDAANTAKSGRRV